MTSGEGRGLAGCGGVARVSDLMSPNPVTVKEDVLVQDVLETMAVRRIRHCWWSTASAGWWGW